MRKEKIISEIPLKESYNIYLFNTRLKRKQKRRAFAKFLGISSFRYGLIEKGYIKPNKKEIEKISKALELDFSVYLQESSQYPSELPDKEQNPIVKFFYFILGSKVVRGLLIGFTLLFMSLFSIFFAADRWIENNASKYLNDTSLQFIEKFNEKSTPNISLIGTLVYPQISQTYKEGNEVNVVQIKGNRIDKEGIPLSFSFIDTFWTEKDRISFDFTSYDEEKDEIHYFVNYLDYESEEYSSFNIKYDIQNYQFSTDATEDQWIIDRIQYFYLAHYIEADFNVMIHDQLGLDLDFIHDVIVPLMKGLEYQSTQGAITSLAYMASMILSAVFLFGSAFAFIFGQKKKEVKFFSYSNELILGNQPRTNFKNDFKFVPFVPELVVTIIGIALVAVGSFRLPVLAFTLISYSSSQITFANENLLSILMIGMFLLYFIDFDTFMDDKRVLRNVFLYPILFLIIYFFEATLLTGIKEADTAVSIALENVIIPNPFASVSCYFLLMLFLFFTPKRIKTKKGLIAYRCLGILPVAYILVSFCIFNGDILFGWDMSNLWFKYFFASERLPYSLLAVGYLVGLFFMRLYFERIYGEKGAQRFFNSNRFIMWKNIFTCAIIIVVWVIEMILSPQVQLHKIGIGINKALIILVPILICYHPHKGPRNLVVDYLTLFLYFLAMAYAFVLAAIVGLLGLASAL
ncbi:MAG: helix-turn-helix transcriptional regulator [Bacilli bacterium]|nr:helix-turn-helix transcriptional regulator [Bacilli bacterium]